MDECEQSFPPLGHPGLLGGFGLFGGQKVCCLLGVDAQETPDGFAIAGKGKLPGGQAHSCGDHRLAMALSIAGLAARTPVTVKGAEATGESFPGYEETLRQLGANIQQTGE